MLTDRLTDTVYFSQWALRDFPVLVADVCRLLEKHGSGYGFLRHTRDYWCQDYMPVQVDDERFVQYAYAPDYLQGDGAERYVTDPSAALRGLGVETVKTGLVIDGGNVVRCPDRVIMTDKVFAANRDVPRGEVAATLEWLFGCGIVFLPWDRSEPFGHADGIVRWVGGDTVLLTAYEMSRHYAGRFLRELERHFDVIVMSYSTRPRNRELTWAYINFLQTRDVIIVPTLNIREDGQALRQIEEAFPDYRGRVEAVDASGIICHGGGLNCISWNIRRPSGNRRAAAR